MDTADIMASFPFTAVVGQDAVKTALLLAIVDPGIDGVLISGSRGSAKSTLVRSLETLLAQRQLVTLPLGATEEMVAGSLQLQQALSDGEVAFAPGLLARAHGGLLYVDEVNLLPDHLVDLLLDVAASGINHVERDGISHRHAAEFILVGTMNPDEGELRPQLLDRFGLMAEVQTRFMLDERREIVRRRVAFDSDPPAFEAEHRQDMSALAVQIDQAGERLDGVELSEAIATEISRRCAAAGVDGFRADITFYRAARAHAALAGRDAVDSGDLDAVEELVLRHRREPGDGREASGTPPENSGSTGGERSAGGPGASPQGSRGVAESRREPIAEAAVLPSSRHANRVLPRKPRQGGDFSAARTPGQHRGARYLPVAEVRDAYRKPHWFRTLADPNNLRRRRGSALRLRYRRPSPRARPIDIVLLDTSASTQLFRALARAKGAIADLARRSYLERARFAVLTFGNERVATILPPQRTPHDIGPVLERIRSGGGTPLYRAIHYLDGLVGKLLQQRADCRIYILTDGRVRGGVERRSANLEHAWTLVVDIELGSFRLARSRYLARALEADYLHLEALEAPPQRG